MSEKFDYNDIKSRIPKNRGSLNKDQIKYFRDQLFKEDIYNVGTHSYVSDDEIDFYVENREFEEFDRFENYKTPQWIIDRTKSQSNSYNDMQNRIQELEDEVYRLQE